jgi:transcriptional regulator of acetoin/glycerol metabolism
LREERGDAVNDLDEAERAALRRALSRTQGNVSKAADVLGLSRATLHRKLKRFNLQ